jgi:hypothetical protein
MFDPLFVLLHGGRMNNALLQHVIDLYETPFSPPAWLTRTAQSLS